jgi:arsenite-transporting ATPase
LRVDAALDSAPVVVAGTRHDHRNFDVSGWLCGLPQRFLLFAGRGGVGKTTCASAAALGLSDQRGVLLVDADPAGSVADVLGVPAGGEITRGARLRVLDVSAEREFQALRERHREAIARVFDVTGFGSATLDRRVHERILDLTPPGIDEVAALAVLTDALDSEETIVVDAAPSGHFLRLIGTPELALEWVHALLRILRRERGPDIMSALEDLLELAGRIRRLHTVLTDAAQSGVLLITTDEPVVRSGTERLGDALAAAGMHRIATVVNRADESCQPLTGKLSGTTLCAPSWPESPVGEAALRQFLGQWECAA